MKRTYLIVLLLIAFCLACAGCGGSDRQPIDMREYIVVTFVGLNTDASAHWDTNIEAVLGPIPEYESASHESYTLHRQGLLSGIVSVNFEPADNLKNGDKVTVTVNCSDDVLKEYGLKAKNTSWAVPVSGLEEGEHLSIFDNVEVAFEGLNGNARAVISSEHPFLKDVSFGIDPAQSTAQNGLLSDGDSIVIKANTDKEEAAENGYIVDGEFTHAYEVRGTWHEFAVDDILGEGIMKAGWNAVQEKYGIDTKPVKMYQALATSDDIEQFWIPAVSTQNKTAEMIFIFNSNDRFWGVFVFGFAANAGNTEIYNPHMTYGRGIASNYMADSVEEVYEMMNHDAHIYSRTDETQWHFEEYDCSIIE